MNQDKIIIRRKTPADEAAAEEFDRSFPPKEKLKLPGQLF